MCLESELDKPSECTMCSKDVCILKSSRYLAYKCKCVMHLT